MKRVLVLLNGRASGSGLPVDNALDVLREVGIDVDVRQSDDADHMRFLIRAECRSVDAVIVGGGDGTVNSALTPMLEIGVPLGVLPMGTANDLARTLGVPTDLHRACTLIASRSVRTIDVGLANGRPFVNAAGIGMSTRVARALTENGKRRLGIFSYPAAVIDAWRRQKPFSAEIVSDEATRRVAAVQVTVGNGVYYGAGTPLAEDSAIDDGRLDLYSVHAQSLAGMIRAAIAVRRGVQREFEEGVDTARGVSFRISTRPCQAVSLDGEPLLETPVRFSVAPASLKVFAPPAAVLKTCFAGE